MQSDPVLDHNDEVTMAVRASPAKSAVYFQAALAFMIGSRIIRDFLGQTKLLVLSWRDNSAV
jgi:hypothetical protein